MTVISRQESGARGYAVTRARYGDRKLNEWRRSGGRKRDPNLLEILAMEREQKAATRAKARLSSRKQEVRHGGSGTTPAEMVGMVGTLNDFDAIT